MDKIYFFPFRHELEHILGKVISGQLMAVKVGSKAVFKRVRALHQSCHIETVIIEVGGKIKVSAGQEKFLQKQNKLPVDEAPFAVLFFRPGVRAVYVDGPQSPWRKPLRNELTRLLTEYPHIPDIHPVDPATGLVASFVIKIYGYEIPVPVVQRGFSEEIADAATDFQRQRIVVTEYGMPVGRLPQVFRPKIVGRINMDEHVHSLDRGYVFLDKKPSFVLS
jgi:hypothetical protein